MKATLCRRGGVTGYFRQINDGERTKLQEIYDECKTVARMAEEIEFGGNLRYLPMLLSSCGIEMPRGQRYGTQHVGPKTNPEDRAKMIVLRNERGMTLAAVGDVFGVSRQYVEQVVKRAKEDGQ